MTRNRIAALLRQRFVYRVNAWRPSADGEETQVVRDALCLLSRNGAATAAPLPPDSGAPTGEVRFRLALLTLGEIRFCLGDRLEIRDSYGRVYRGWASDSFCYATHTETVVEVTELTAETD